MKKEVKQRLNPKTKKIIGISSVAIFIILSVLIVIFVGKPLIRFLDEPQKFRDWIDTKGIAGRFIFVGIVVLQIIVALIPGEPVETAAGYAFGAVEGTFLCMIGIFIGSMAVFLFVKKIGVRAVEAFFPIEKINSLKFLHDPKRRNILAFIIFFIPGTPKDLLTYFAGLTDMTVGMWIFISTVGRFPSVISSTIGGNALGNAKYETAIIVYVVTAVLSLAGLFIYKKIVKKYKYRKKKDEK